MWQGMDYNQYINSSQWKKSGDFGRITTSNLAASFSLKSKVKTQERSSKFGTEQELEYIRANPDAFIDFNVSCGWWELNPHGVATTGS